jgi:hypothetical protein
MQTQLVLEAPIPRRGDGTRGLIFVVSLGCVVGGAIYLLSRPSPWPVVAILLGIGLFAWLLRAEPRAVYAVYAEVDAQGLTYYHSPGSHGRLSRYVWNEISELRVGYDPIGIVLSKRNSNVPIFLATRSSADAQRIIEHASLYVRSNAV